MSSPFLLIPRTTTAIIIHHTHSPRLYFSRFPKSIFPPPSHHTTTSTRIIKQFQQQRSLSTTQPSNQQNQQQQNHPPINTPTNNTLMLIPVALSACAGIAVLGYLYFDNPNNNTTTNKNKSNHHFNNDPAIIRRTLSGINADVDPSSSSPNQSQSSTNTTTTTTNQQRIRKLKTISDKSSASSAVTFIQSVGEKVTPSELRHRYEYRLQPSIPGGRRKHLQVIGKGAYGRVVSAISKESGRDVAMKVVSSSAMTAESLLKEVEVLRRVRGHDNIIHLLEVFECEDEWYLVTELCEGGDLLDRLISCGPYDELTAARVFVKTASALNHVHLSGYAHGDVKPENIAFVSKGNTRNDPNADDVRLIDFGSTKDLHTSLKTGEFSLTLSSSPTVKSAYFTSQNQPRMGTVAYWSPEQVKAGGAHLKPDERTDEHRRMVLKGDPRKCDAWALGVVLYVMLFGCHPFDLKGEGNELRIAQNILKGEVRFDVHGDRVVLSKEAVDIMSRLLDPNPETRMTINEVAQHPWIQQFILQSTTTNNTTLTNNKIIEQRRPSDTINHAEYQHKKLERLPTSWKRSGFMPNTTPCDSIVNTLPTQDIKTYERLKPFQSLDTTLSLVQAVLLTSVAMASEGITGSQALFKGAFDALDAHQRGYITMSDIEEFNLALKRGPKSGEAFSSTVIRATANALGIHSNNNNNNNATTAPNNNSSPQQQQQRISSPGELQALLKKNAQCVIREFNPGQVVFEQGAVPEGVYVLLEGQARVEWRPPTNKAPSTSITAKEYATIPSGSIIGETAIVQGRVQRSATVRIVEPSQVLFVPKDEFLQAMASSKALHDKIFMLTNEQQEKRVFQLVQRWNPSQYKRIQFNPGDVLFRQGDIADTLYLIQNGLVEVSISSSSKNQSNPHGISVRVGQRGQGDIVGVSAATGAGKRHTTATALTKCEVVAVSRTELEKIMQEMPILQFYIESQKRWRNENWQSVLSEVERGVSEPQLLPLLAESVEEDQGYSFEAYQRELMRAKQKFYKPGEYIFKRGERAGELFAIESGRADVLIRAAESGNVMAIAQLGPGDHIGEQSLLDGRAQYAFTVKAVSPVELRTIPEARFLALLGDRGSSSFARAIRLAMRQRRHRWVKNLLALAVDNPPTEEDAKSRGMSLEELRENWVQTIVLEPGDELFTKGEPIEKLFFVQRGEFTITKPDGTNVKTLTPGDTIGWEVFREGGSISEATATCTLAKTVVLALPKSTLEILLSKHRYVSSQLEKHASSPEVPGGSQSSNMKRRGSIGKN
jgi:CRP-like cAMP-binding protein/serine/threonine protein kinase